MIEIKAALMEFCKEHEIFISRVQIENVDTISITKNDGSEEINILWADGISVDEYQAQNTVVDGKQMVLF
jgi:hypothetical protein